MMLDKLQSSTRARRGNLESLEPSREKLYEAVRLWTKFEHPARKAHCLRQLVVCNFL